MHKTLLTLGLITVAIGGSISQSRAEAVLGYTDTPMLPSGKWHVHDPARPVPPVVPPAKFFSDGAPPPSDAVVLFNGKDLSHWHGDNNGDAKWKIHRDYMEVVPHSGYIWSKETFGNFQLHVEWAEPAQVKGDSQERGNSGVFLQGIYEIQVLDCYNNPTYPDGQCGAMYGQTPPLVNACRKPGEWQTYDIFFQAAKFDENHKLVTPAYVTVIQNGILIHHKQAFLGPTGHRILANYDKETPALGPIGLQDHGNPVRFRNIWIRNINEEEIP